MIDQIKANAVREEEREIFVPLDYNVLDDMRKEFTDISIQLAKEEDILATKVAEHKANIKAFKLQARELLKTIKDEGQLKQIKCFLVANQESGNMEYFDPDGVLVYQRRLFPNERQFNIFQNNQAAN